MKLKPGTLSNFGTGIEILKKNLMVVFINTRPPKSWRRHDRIISRFLWKRFVGRSLAWLPYQFDLAVVGIKKGLEVW